MNSSSEEEEEMREEELLLFRSISSDELPPETDTRLTVAVPSWWAAWRGGADCRRVWEAILFNFE